MNSKLVFAAMTAVAVIAWTQPVVAQTATPPAPTVTPRATADDFADDRRIWRGDRAMFGESFVLRSNETLRGDLAVFGGDVSLERGSVVEGDVAVFGGNLNIAGRVTGDLAHFGGAVQMSESAKIEGRSLHIGGGRLVEEGAEEGERGEWILPGPLAPLATPMPFLVPEPLRSWTNDTRMRWMGDGSDLWKVFPGSLLITLLALIVWALLPRNIDRAADVARAQPLFVGGVGAFSLIAGVIALIVSLVLIVTLCTNPLIATAAIGLSWTVTARIIGAEVARALDRAGWTPTGQVAVGSLIMALLGAIPLIGNLFGFAFVSLGLGALVLTRLGTREWRPTADDRRPLEEGPQTAVCGLWSAVLTAPSLLSSSAGTGRRRSRWRRRSGTSAAGRAGSRRSAGRRRSRVDGAGRRPGWSRRAAPWRRCRAGRRRGGAAARRWGLRRPAPGR